jgi:formate hydrogenlyase subunit 3/multisubunit Na+/H+ antiporter MnhD subunit
LRYPDSARMNLRLSLGPKGSKLDQEKSVKLLTASSFVLALMQSICTAVFTISGIRLAIGLTAFALAGSAAAPIQWFHQDAIRIPMLVLAAIGAIADLLVLAWMRHLRSQPAAQWRRREKSGKERLSQRLQVAVAILTLLLVGLETWTHGIMSRRAHAHATAQTQVTRITS